MISAIGEDVAQAVYRAQTQIQKQVQALGQSIDQSKITDVGQAIDRAAIDSAKVVRIGQAMTQTIDSAKVVNIGRAMEQALPKDLPQIAIPALSWRQGFPDRLNLMQRTCAAPELIHTKPKIIVPDSEDVEAVALQKPISRRGNAPYHELHFERAKEIYCAGFRTGPYQIAVDIIDERGWSRSRNDVLRKGMVLGASENAAKHALGGQIKQWIEGGKFGQKNLLLNKIIYIN